MIWLARLRTCQPQFSRSSRSFSFSSRLWLPRPTQTLKTAHHSRTIPSFRDRLARTNTVRSFRESLAYPPIGRHILFVLGSSCLLFGVAAHDTNVVTAFWEKYFPKMSPVLRFHTPTTLDILRARQAVLAARLSQSLKSLAESLSSAPALLKSVVLHASTALAEAYLNATEGRRVGWGICVVNVSIWLLWQVPRLRPFMQAHFTHNPLSGKAYTLFTSMFSHASFFHMLINSLALTSFASATTTWMRQEQARSHSGLLEATTTYHFLAMFISAGLFSSLVSHIVSARLRYPRLLAALTAPTLAHLTAAVKTTPILPSLGASGAIYATVLVSAFAFPSAQLSLVFPPTPAFPITYGVGAMVLLDCVGVLRGWRLFDHWAHLGGALFGVVYYCVGPTVWNRLRASLLPLAGKPKEKEKEA